MACRILVPSVCVCVCWSFSHVWLCYPTGKLLYPWTSPDKNTGVGCHSLLQEIFPTQGSNPCLLHWRGGSLLLSHLGSLFGRLHIFKCIFDLKHFQITMNLPGHNLIGNWGRSSISAYQAPPSMEFSRQEYWSGLPFPSPGDLPDPGIEPRSSAL